MKKYLLYLILLFSCCVGYSQGEANIWYFGRYAGLDFNNGAPVFLSDGQLDTVEGCATIGDSNGQLLFYTNGERVWDRNHQIMPNGIGLLGNFSTTQSAVIVPNPADPSKYYIFTCTDKDHNDGVRYSEVDMNLNGGMGDVTTTKNILLLDPTCEKLTAVKNQAGDGYWVMAHEFGNSNFHAYSVTSSGVNTNSVVSSLGYFNPGTFVGKSGSLKFSPDGTKLVNATVSLGAPPSLSTVEIFDFNGATGQLSNLRTVSGRIANYGVEFSPSGNLLYVTTGDFWSTQLAVYDLTATNIPPTEVILNNFPPGGFPSYGTLQLGPDNKIYVAVDYGFPITNHTIGVINNPEVYGLGCNYQVEGVNLGSVASCYLGLPQFVQSYFIASFNAENLCLGSITEFTLNTSSTPLSVLWNFGDGFSSTDLNPSHEYLYAGNYNVEVTITSTTGSVTKSKQITIFGNPIIAANISNQSICGVANMNFDLSQFNATVLGSQLDVIYDVGYFSTLNDATSHANILSINQSLQSGTNIFFAKIYNSQNNSCYAVTSFSVALNLQPVANTPSPYTICEDAPYDNIEVFDLTTKNSEILLSQDSSQFTITYHSSQFDADNDSNSLPYLYSNSFPSETLFVRIENNNEPSCYVTAILEINIIQEPQIITVSDFVLCDDSSNDGIASFDLNQKTAEILNGQSLSTFQVKYFYSLTDAQNGANSINSSIINASNNQIIYYSISAIGNVGCKSVSSFNLVVSSMPNINTANDIFICDDPSNDGFGFFDLQSNLATIIGNQNSNQYNITYYLNQIDANLHINPLPINYQNISNPQVIYVRMENNQNANCFVTASFQIGLYKMPTAFQVNNLYTCDNDSDGVEPFDLTQQGLTVLGAQSSVDFEISYHLSLTEATQDTNSLNVNFTNTVNPQTIYVRIENRQNGRCFSITSFNLEVKARPYLNLDNEYTMCEGYPITLNATPGLSSYNWSNGSITPSTLITNPGSYTLTAVRNYGNITCDVTESFIVNNSNIANITQIITKDWTDNQNMITVEVTGDGDYEYSLDGINYQDDNYFIGLDSGQYMVYVRDKKGCGIRIEDVFLLMYPKFFTPNGDGINDTWQIKFSRTEPNMEIILFDRYGKLIRNFKGSSFGWDGTYNGQMLFSDDYWFVVKRSDGREYKGHFTLKR